ncbi:MAG TPA: SDR family NAD(P)-dependent oxidoreductase [Anaerolineales bacterium]|nr:SDR family NAD(P)-dependent oxidoreductase [Anaerolineales bacterium]
MNDVQKLTGKIALITGASRGLGKAVALELAKAGAYVIVTGRSTRGRSTQSELPATTIDDTVDAVHEAGGEAEAVKCDHTDTAAVKTLVDYIGKQHGKLDILVNNAWGGHDPHDESVRGEEVWEEPLDQFKNMLLAGPYSDYITSLLVLKYLMGPIQKGLIITTTWHTAEPPMWTPYEASKAAKNRLVYVLGYHLKDKGIPVVAVAPGWMRTELMFTHHTKEELEGQTETPHYAARGITALASDPDVMRFTGKLMDVSDLADIYGVTDLDGSQPRLNAQHLSQEG